MCIGFYVVGKLLGYKNNVFINCDIGEIKECYIMGI